MVMEKKSISRASHRIHGRPRIRSRSIQRYHILSGEKIKVFIRKMITLRFFVFKQNKSKRSYFERVATAKKIHFHEIFPKIEF